MNQKDNSRIISYDILRILAAFSVVMLHSTAQFWYDGPVTAPEWQVINSYNSLVRFGVPVFVMISGALFLDSDREFSLKKLLLHNVLRLALLYIIWSCLYGIYDCFQYGFEHVNLQVLFNEMFYGRYHLWYLPMLVGIYLIVPVLRTWLRAADRRQVEYLLLLFLLFKICRETILAVFTTSNITYALSLVTPELACSYVGYFILGYYIVHIGIPQRYHKWIYLAVIPSIIMNIYLGNRISLWKGEPRAAIYDSFGGFTFVIVTALFLAVVSGWKRGQKETVATKILRELSRDTLGVYLVHIGVLEFLQTKGIHSMMIHPFLGVPLMALLAFLISLTIAAMLRRIPVVGRYLC